MKRINMIKKNDEFKHIIENGVTNKTPYFRSFILPKKEKYFRIGISVPKKLGSAVLRNKIKRQIRHIINNSTDSFNLKQDCIIIINSNFISLEFKKKQELLENLIKRIGENHDKK